MKIDVSEDRFALERKFSISRGSKTEAQVLTVTVTQGAFIGRGECVPYGRYGETLASVRAQIEGITGDNRLALQTVLPAGAARNALDCALWDLEAKKSGKRVWEVAGLSKPKPIVTAFTLSLDAPEVMEEQARANAKHPVLKIKLGTPDDLPRLEAVRRGAPDAKLIVDANEGWNSDIYLGLVPDLQRLGVALVEQPFPVGADDMLLTLPRPVPVCADESCHDRSSLAGLKGRYDMVNIKLDKTGGLTEALELKAAAAEMGFGIMVGCMVGTSLAMAPAVLVAQGASVTDLDGPLLLAQDRKQPLIYDTAGVHPPAADLWG